MLGIFLHHLLRANYQCECELLFLSPSHVVKQQDSSRLHLSIASRRSLDQAPQAQIVNDVLDPLDLVLYAIGALADNVVFEVEQLKAGKEVLDKGADGEGQLEVAEGDCVCGEAGEILGEVDEGEEVFLYGEVEGVAVFEVCWD